MRTALSLVFALVVGCSSSDDPKKPSPTTDGGSAGSGSSSGGASNGGASTGGGGSSGHAGTGGSITDVPCGNAICKPIADQSVESNACCTAQTTCGYRLPITQKCLATNQPGTVNPVCAAFQVQGKVQYPGCCSPKGCGARVTTGGIGCVENTDLGLPHVDCVYDTNPVDAGGPALDSGSAAIDGG
ncbi:MAG TPA: hypothetical protein VHE30_16700 [Polyangiaceae bacterium]|nr:hypothetical protein [Polyangiaceae bacterium]